MSNDWPRLIRIRERQKATAAEALAGARLDTERTASVRDEAQRTLDARATDRSASWQGAMGKFTTGVLDIERLRRAGSFDAVASRRIVEAHHNCKCAHVQLQHAQARSYQAQTWLRSRSAALEKAERIEQQAKLACRQLDERRAEEGSESAAVSAWIRRPSRTGT